MANEKFIEIGDTSILFDSINCVRMSPSTANATIHTKSGNTILEYSPEGVPELPGLYQILESRYQTKLEPAVVLRQQVNLDNVVAIQNEEFNTRLLYSDGTENSFLLSPEKGQALVNAWKEAHSAEKSFTGRFGKQ